MADPAEFGFIQEDPYPHYIVNYIDAAPKALKWNGVPVAAEGVRRFLAISRSMEPPPIIVLRISEETDCSVSRHMLELISENYDCTGGRCQAASQN